MLKKVIKMVLYGGVCILGLTSLGSFDTEQQSAVIRKGNSGSEEINYFDSIEESNNEIEYRTIAKKKISGNALSDFESVSYLDDEYLITYEVTAKLEEGTMTLNVYFDKSGERIIENFTGIPMTNYNDDEDILFTIDDSHIFLSELNSLSEQEQCSWFGNVLHRALNANMLALSYIEPAIKILVYSSINIKETLYTSVKNTSYLVNYELNSKKSQPSEYVYGQGYFEDWRFGFSNMAYAGCEVIAGYNLAYALGRNYTLAETIFLYESLGIEIGIAQGFFGSNPYQISYFLAATGIPYKKALSYKTFKKYMEDDKDYFVILSRWNGENANSQIHTFMIDKDKNYTYKFHAYNYSIYENDSTKKDNYLGYFGASISNTYICAYFVTK